MINDSNIETYIIEYLDGELDPASVAQLLLVIEQNPRYAQMLEAYRGAYLSIDDEVCVFPDKELLLRKPGRMRLWMSVGLAAGLAAAVGVFLLMKPDIPSDQPAGHGVIAQKAVQHSQPADTGTVTGTRSGTGHTSNPPGNHLYAVNKQNKKEKSNIPSRQERHQPEQAGGESYAYIEKIPVKTSPRNMEYNQVIQVSYVTLIKEPLPVSKPVHSGAQPGADDLEVKVAGVVLNQELQQIKSIQDKFDKLKERFTDNLALLSGISLTISK